MKKVSAGYYIKRCLLVVLLGVLLGVFFFAAYQLYQTFHGYREADREYSNLNEQYVSTQPAAATAAPEEENEPALLVSGPIDVDFASLKAENEEIVGWIYGPDSPISFPVVKGTDNEYYLYHSFRRELNQSGTIFMDTVCDVDLNQDNTILYGHHMNNGGMFASLEKYREEGYLQAHPVLYYYTPEETYVLEVFSMFVTGGDSDVYAFNFASDEEYLSFVNTMRSRTDYNVDIDVDADDRIMTLSTCAYDYDDARYVVLCKIEPMQEALAYLQAVGEDVAEVTITAAGPTQTESVAQTENTAETGNAQQAEITTA